MNSGTKAIATDFNKLLSRLETVRANHAGKQSVAALNTRFNTSVAAAGNSIVTSNVQAIKTNLNTLANSTWLDTTFASRITVPSAGTLIRASDFNVWDNTITAVEAVCANYQNYSNYGNYGEYSNYTNYGHYDYTAYSNYYNYGNYYQYRNYSQT